MVFAQTVAGRPWKMPIQAMKGEIMNNSAKICPSCGKPFIRRPGRG